MGRRCAHGGGIRWNESPPPARVAQGRHPLDLPLRHVDDRESHHVGPCVVGTTLPTPAPSRYRVRLTLRHRDADGFEIVRPLPTTPETILVDLSDAPGLTTVEVTMDEARYRESVRHDVGVW